jgi:hypothetical protein
MILEGIYSFARNQAETINKFLCPALPPGISPLGAEKLVIPAEHQKPQI